MARARSGSAIARQWEKCIESKLEEARLDFERRRHEENERRRARVRDLAFQDSAYGSIAHNSMSNLEQDRDVQELDAQQYTPRHDKQEAQPTPQASELGTLTDTDILELQRQIDRQDTTVKNLEAKLKAEQSKTRHLQAERHEAVNAQRQAILASDDGEIQKWKAKVSSLLELLDQSTERQKDLERQVEEGKAKEQELRERLHCAERRMREPEANFSLHEPRQTPTPYQSHETTPARDYDTGMGFMEQRGQQQGTEKGLPDIAQQHQQDAEEENGTIHSTMYAPSSSRKSRRSRKHARQMDQHGYISLPKSWGRRGLLKLSEF